MGYTNETEGIYDATKDNVIIFDDFTTATKFVDFKFKVKSSAMKILISKASQEYNIKYFYYLLKTIHINSDTHKRFWISEYEDYSVCIPPNWYQNLVVDFLDVLFCKIDLIYIENKKLVEIIETVRTKILDYFFNENSSYKSYYGARIKTTLKELINPNDIGDGDWVLSENMTENGDYNLIQLKHIGFGKYLEKSYKSIDNNFFKDNSCTEIKKGYILINRLIANEMDVCILPELRFKTIAAVDVCWIAPNENYNQKYLMYYLLSPQFQKEVLMNGSGTTRKRISKNNLIKLPLFLHERANQELIVSKIEKSFEVLDNIIK